MHTIHGSSTNRTDSWRLSVDFRVQPCHAPPTLVSQNKGRQSGRRVLSYLASTPLPPSRGRWSRLRHSRSDFPRSMDEAHLKAHGSSHHWPCDGSSFESEAKTAWNLHEAKKRWVLLTDAHGGVPAVDADLHRQRRSKICPYGLEHERILSDIDEGRRLLMASHDADDAEAISCSGASGHSRDMQKELDEWRQQRARQGKAKESTLERSFTAITPKKMQRRIPLSPRCSSVDSSSTTVQERDMRKELQSWKEARARQSRGKENLLSQPCRGVKSQRPRATDMRRASSPASPTDPGCFMGSPGLGGSAVAAAIAALEPPLLLAPPPSPTARTYSNCTGLGSEKQIERESRQKKGAEHGL